LIAALKDTDGRVRWRAAWALGNFNDLRAVEPLIAALRDTDGEVRMGVAWSLKELGNLKDARVVELLAAALKDEDRNVRANAVRTLGRIKDARAVEPLISALKDESAYVRESAGAALKGMGWRPETTMEQGENYSGASSSSPGIGIVQPPGPRLPPILFPDRGGGGRRPIP
jgi:HEAT repeat protein